MKQNIFKKDATQKKHDDYVQDIQGFQVIFN